MMKISWRREWYVSVCCALLKRVKQKRALLSVCSWLSVLFLCVFTVSHSSSSVQKRELSLLYSFLLLHDSLLLSRGYSTISHPCRRFRFFLLSSVIALFSPFFSLLISHFFFSCVSLPLSVFFSRWLHWMVFRSPRSLVATITPPLWRRKESFTFGEGAGAESSADRTTAAPSRSSSRPWRASASFKSAAATPSRSLWRTRAKSTPSAREPRDSWVRGLGNRLSLFFFLFFFNFLICFPKKKEHDYFVVMLFSLTVWYQDSANWKGRETLSVGSRCREKSRWVVLHLLAVVVLPTSLSFLSLSTVWFLLLYFSLFSFFSFLFFSFCCLIYF